MANYVDIKLLYQHTSGLSLFTPITKLDDVKRDNIKFQFPPCCDYQSKEYFLHDYEKCYKFNGFDDNYLNHEGSVIINDRWEVFAVIVNNKCIRSETLKIIEKEALDIFFANGK